MSEERIAELVAALKLATDARMVVNVDMGQGADAFVIVEGTSWWASVRRSQGTWVHRRGTFKAQ